MMNIPEHGRLRRASASQYLDEKHGVKIAETTLAKLASIGGGPAITYVGRFPLYHVSDLDSWANARISNPVASTSEKRDTQ